MKICFYGAGNIAQAIIEGLLKANFGSHNIACIERNPEKIESLQLKNIRVLSKEELSDNRFDFIILAVKPKDAIRGASDILSITPNANILSVVAGITLEKYSDPTRIIRSMPNTASAFNKGITALYSENQEDPVFRSAVNLFKNVGHVIELKKEDDIHSFTSIIGSGQAFLFRVLKIYLEELKQLNENKDETASEMFKDFVGSLGDLFEQEPDFDMLIGKIRSPGGTTEAGLNSLESNNIDSIFKAAFQAASDRSTQISNEN
tara:strand:+ start:149 stop:934 length:786 start_codon:yes stop_codon:yes gene_type:complete